MWHKDLFSLARDSCSSILLINYLPQVFTVWVITYQGRDLTVLGPVLTPKRITIEVVCFTSGRATCLYPNPHFRWKDGIFLPVVKKYISAKNFG